MFLASLGWEPPARRVLGVELLLVGKIYGDLSEIPRAYNPGFSYANTRSASHEWKVTQTSLYGALIGGAGEQNDPFLFDRKAGDQSMIGIYPF